MPSNHPLHPIASARLQALKSQLERQFGCTDSERNIVNALVYGANPSQAVGMLETFARDRRAYNDLHADDPEGVEDRKYASQ
jgi:hypothetical protein